MANLKNVIYLSNEDYETLVSTGTVTIDGETLTYDENNVYITPDKLASTTEDGLMSAADKSKLDNIESGAQVNVQVDWNQTDTTADDYIKNKLQVDTDFSLTSTNPIQNKVISEKLEYIDYALTHIKYKLFGVTTLSEIDYKVDYATIYPIPETLSDNDGTHRVVYSDTQLKEVEGNSVAFNQKLHNELTSNGAEGHEYANNGTLSISDGKMTITSTGIAQAYFGVGFGNLSSLQNHKVLCSSYVSTISVANTFADISFEWGLSNITDRSRTTSAGNYTYAIGTWGSSQTATYLNLNQGTPIEGDYFVIENYMIFDLTQMFGAGNEPTTVEEFNRIFPLTYYPYNAGEIRSTVIKGVKVNGYNLFDGELQQGYYDTATEPIIIKNDNNYICSKEKIRVVAGRTYTLETNDDIFALGLNAIYIGFADENGKHISWNSNSVSKTITFTIPNNAYWCYFEYLKSSGISVPSLNKCAFHLTGTRTGYAPYKAPHTINIPQTKLLSAGSVHDTIKFVEGNVVAGQQRYNMMHVSRINHVDLGTLTYTKQSSYTASAVGLQSLIKKPSAYNVKAEVLCPKYVTVAEGSITSSVKSIAISADNGIFLLNDSAYTDYTEQQIKTAMSGVILNYEKATPTETTLATDLTFEEVSAIIEQGGSIETVFEIVPPNLKTAFVVNKAIVS